MIYVCVLCVSERLFKINNGIVWRRVRFQLAGMLDLGGKGLGVRALTDRTFAIIRRRQKLVSLRGVVSGACSVQHLPSRLSVCLSLALTE